MSFKENLPAGGALTVTALSAEGATIGGLVCAAPLLAWPKGVAPIEIRDESDFTEAALAPLFAIEPTSEVVIIGCGARGWLPRLSLKAPLKARGIACEFMDSRAAARTYSMLVADGRNAALILVAL